jgi:filamentous hemagglutinin
VGDYAKGKLEEAKKNNDAAGMDAWKEGGTNRVALHVAVGVGVASAAAPAIEQLQDQLKTALTNAGASDSAATLIASLAAGTTAAGIGAAASGGTLAGAATAFNADMNNRQLHPTEVQKAKELAAKSEGRYTQAQIEEQMRLMGNEVTREQANTITVLTNKEAIVSSYENDPGMPRTAQGAVVVEVPGQANAALQSWIIGNTRDSARYIPGVSPYVASNLALDKPMTSSGPSQNTLPTARCANADLACLSGVGAQQSSTPELTQAAREAIASTSASTSRQMGVVAAGATAIAAGSAPPLKPIAGSVAVGATAIGIAAAAVEQVVRPNAGQTLVTLGGTVLLEQASTRVPGAALITNEIIEALKDSDLGSAVKNDLNKSLGGTK